MTTPAVRPRWTAWRTVVGFGVVSLLADMVYEGARSLYGPALLALGAGAAVVGLVTGAGEAMALVLSPNPPICAYCASPTGPTGIAGNAQQTPRYAFAFPASHCTHLWPLATAPTGGSRL